MGNSLHSQNSSSSRLPPSDSSLRHCRVAAAADACPHTHRTSQESPAARQQQHIMPTGIPADTRCIHLGYEPQEQTLTHSHTWAEQSHAAKRRLSREGMCMHAGQLRTRRPCKAANPGCLSCSA